MTTTSRQLIPVNGAAAAPYVFQCQIPTNATNWFYTHHNNLRSVIPGARYMRDDRNGAPRPNLQALMFDNDPRQAGLVNTSIRRTVALDIKFDADYLNGSHFALMAFHGGQPYAGPGDNRSAALIMGGFGGSATSVGLEEIEIAPRPDLSLPYGGNAFHHIHTNVLSPNVWYRAALDVLFLGTTVSLYGRVWNKTTGLMVYEPSTYNFEPSVNSGAYIKNSDLVGFADINYGGKVEIKNMVGYWGLAGNFVPAP